MASAFVYGTLMHPKILKRVLHNDARHLKICPAILMVGPSYTQRHAPRTIVDISNLGLHPPQSLCTLAYYCSTSGVVATAYVLFQRADYPAILPCERGKALLGREVTPEENCVRGTLVTGLTPEDFTFLDVFEGNVRLFLYSILSSRLTTWLFLALLVRNKLGICSQGGAHTSSKPIDGCSIGCRGIFFGSDSGRWLVDPSSPSADPVGRRAGAAYPSTDIRVVFKGQLSGERVVVIRGVRQKQRV